MINFNLEDAYRESLQELGIKLEDLYEYEIEEQFTKRGELAASLLESLATQDIPAMGYGIRYSFNNYSLPKPGFMANTGNPWEIERFDVQQEIHYGGHLERKRVEEHGIQVIKTDWVSDTKIKAMAYTTA